MPGYRTGHVATMAEYGIAGELAAAYRALDCVDGAQLLSCSEVLRTFVRGLLELSGPLARSVRLHTIIERLSLPAFNRRAMTLIASRLVMFALSRAVGRKNLRLDGSLLRPERRVGRLIVADNVSDQQRVADRIVDDLAGLLECDSARHASPGSGVATELRFPI